MENYRIYIMGYDGRHIEDFVALSALCDAEAILAVRRRQDRQPAELWLGARKVCAFAPFRDGPAASNPCPTRAPAPLRVRALA